MIHIIPPLVYVAGPFSPTKKQKANPQSVPRAFRYGRGTTFARAAVEQNILKAKLLGLEVAKLGACPWIPHANTDLPEFETVQPYTFWIAVTGEQLRRCDAVIFTDDYQESSGAVGEEQIAIATGKPCLYNLEELKAWLAL